jgi:hypothetical protein
MSNARELDMVGVLASLAEVKRARGEDLFCDGSCKVLAASYSSARQGLLSNELLSAPAASTIAINCSQPYVITQNHNSRAKAPLHSSRDVSLVCTLPTLPLKDI